ncbi:MAG: hypothetical protein ABW208_28190 [Pyrinomonadaceae bacterium]
MKNLIFTLVVCLGLLGTSAWLIAHPVHAMSTEITCRDGSKRSCSGQSCTGSDAIPGSTNGWCQCTNATPGGPADVEDCDRQSGEPGTIAPVKPPEA